MVAIELVYIQMYVPWCTVAVITLSKHLALRASEQFEDTKGVIRIRKSMKDRQYNGKKQKDKRANYNDQ
jgi:hypothetical protein